MFQAWTGSFHYKRRGELLFPLPFFISLLIQYLRWYALCTVYNSQEYLDKNSSLRWKRHNGRLFVELIFCNNLGFSAFRFEFRPYLLVLPSDWVDCQLSVVQHNNNSSHSVRVASVGKRADLFMIVSLSQQLTHQNSKKTRINFQILNF